jgi:hypothetical protein
MKRIFVQGIVFLSLFVFAIPAWSLTITDVGGIDQLLYSTRLADSGDAGVLQWIRDSLDDPTLSFSKFDTTGSNWVQLDGMPDVYAIGLQNEPAFFFIKIGVGGLTSTAPDHFLFSNQYALNFAVVDIVSAGFTIENIGKISHVGAIPEPSTLILLGGGLLGLAVYGRRRMKN